MTQAAAIQGTYSDFKLVKSRSVAQVVVELPIEHADRFLEAFGVPVPGLEKPVALALLNLKIPVSSSVATPEKGSKRWADLSKAQQSGILCADQRFQNWIAAKDEDGAAKYVRRFCGVASRTHLNTDKSAGEKFDRLVAHFRSATGQSTEMRG